MSVSRFVIACTATFSIYGLGAASLAQTITPAPDGTGTLITIEGNTYHIQGGTQAGANLFHSFQDFGLSTGEIANFLSDPSVTNIFGRVTGGNASIINGLIQANSNLYLMNPAGLVFGSGARLHVGGDFTATTADRIDFEGGWFNATGANDYAALVGVPNQFAFLSEQPGAILNFGALNTAQDVSLVGGTILNEGQVVSTMGNVTIAAVPGERLVRIGQPGMLLSLELPQDLMAAGIIPVDLPTLLTGSGRGNPPVVAPNPAGVSTGALPLQNGDVVIAGEIAGQQVDLYATGQVIPGDADLIHGDTRVVRFSATGENPDQAVFIDARADSPEQLLYGAEAGTVSQIVERDEDGIAVITEQLAEISDAVGELDSVAIVAEGNEGNFWLGNQWIRAGNIADYAAQLQTWGTALTESADLLLYSCFTALGASGEALVQSIASMTEADVAASVDVTGSTNYGGDWTLESSTGTIEAENPFTTETLNLWDGKLAVFTVATATQAALEQAIVDANNLAGADEIHFAPGVTSITLTSALSTITEDLTIMGQGTNVTVQRDTTAGAFRIFDITANDLTISDLTIRNGSVGAGLRGGGILGYGNVELTNVVVSGNSSGTAGGVYSYGNIELANAVVSGNLAGTAGGVYSRGNATLTHSEISGNSASTGIGGIGVRGNATLTHSEISGNLGGGNGGGIIVRENATLTQSVISGNSADGDGGGIVGLVGNMVLTNTLVSGNLASGNGGGILSQTGTVTITDHVGDLNLDISANNAVSLSGPDSITVTGDLVTNGAPLTINAGTTIDTTTLTLSTRSNSGGGNITMTAGGDITTRNLIAASTGSGNGGNIKLESRGGSIHTLIGGGNGSLDTTAPQANAGTVELLAPLGITTGAINTEAVLGTGGAIALESRTGLVRVDGVVESSFKSFAASLSTAGKTGSGAILIRHGGNGLIPFTVGDGSLNGTAAAITNGAQTIFPTSQYLGSNTDFAGLQILTNGAIGTNLDVVLAGVSPIHQTLDTRALIRRLGRQAGGTTNFTIDEQGNETFSWDLPDEKAVGGSMTDNEIFQAFVQLDTALGDAYSLPSEELAETTDEGGDSDDAENSMANIRETFNQISEQTGTVPALIYALSQPDGLELIVVTPDNQLLRKIVPEADRTTLQGTIRAFRRRITGLSPNYLPPAQQLYDWLIRPIESSINNLNIDTLVFAMGDGLRTLPMSALHDGEQFLVEKYSLGQIPSLSLTDSSYIPLQDANVLAMGASQFDFLNPLPAVPSELSLITHLKSGEQHLNQGFTWENLATQSRGRGFEIVHLATHATFKPGSATNSYIQLWGNDQISVDELRELRWFEDPQVELLVLSACETAFGDPYAELGFAGLAVQAGVKSTLASLWQISDLGTMRLMQVFYEQLSNPDVTIKAEALRQAQLALLRGEVTAQNALPEGMTLPPELARYANTDLTHPFYWSAFTLVGSPW
ncbi:MAG: CHAT domain-containing protein [Cyanobacteria bacterium P01_G01_bin.54]